jgi:hypothetical protein
VSTENLKPTNRVAAPASRYFFARAWEGFKVATGATSLQELKKQQSVFAA